MTLTISEGFLKYLLSLLQKLSAKGKVDILVTRDVEELAIS